jgi:SAM-dependent methyltransferase
MTEFKLLLDLHLRNDRQGPGGDESTRQALAMTGLRPSPDLAVADLGCGTGAASLILARDLEARVTAVDAAEPFIARLRERAAVAGLADRIDARQGLMEEPPFAEGSLDLIWSEGAIYNIGFADGVRGWRRLLRPGGVLAVTELSWLTDRRPEEVEAYWNEAYPGMASASGNLHTLEAEGFQTIGLFVLPTECWWKNYLDPLRKGFPAFLARHGESAAAREIVAAEEAEMDILHAGSECCGYVFFIARRWDGPEAG